MFERIFGYPIQQASEDALLEMILLPDDDYISHTLIAEAIIEKERRINNVR